MRKFVFYWLPLVLYLLLIFYLSSIPGLKPITTRIVFIDKWEHMLEYFILSILIFRLGKKYNVKKRYLIALSFAGLYGIIDEVHQYFVVNRICDLGDMVANYIGCCFILFRKLFKNRFNSSYTG